MELALMERPAELRGIAIRRSAPDDSGDINSGRKLSIGMYSFDVTGSTEKRMLAYRFFAGQPKELRPGISFWGYPTWTPEYGVSLASVKPIPEAWACTMAQAFSHMGSGGRMDVGYIVYELDPKGRWARTSEYYPKDDLPGKRTGLNLPYFLEAMATKDLKNHGVEYIGTSDKPKPARLKQLWRVELQANRLFGVDEWLLAMGRGIRDYLHSQMPRRAPR